MSVKIIDLNDDSFEMYIVKKADKLILVDFWAEWCSSCKVIIPILDEIANEYQDKIFVAKLNIDQNQSITIKYGIRSIPTLLLFRNRKVVATKVGIISKEELRKFLDVNLT